VLLLAQPSSLLAVLLRFRTRALPDRGHPHIMAVVNATPDSFYDRGATATADAAVERALAVVAEGATLIDIGGMTAQPGAVIAPERELERVLPVIEGVRAEGCDAVISVDTYRADVAAAVLDAGADLINDHTGLTDGDLAAAVAERGGGLVVTHLGLAPKQVQGGRYDIDPAAIAAFLAERAAAAEAAGIAADAIVVDPGLGFGKSTATDLATLRALPELLALPHPLLLACSHKEVTAEPLGLPETALEGTAAVVAVAAFLGVPLLRVHDLPFMARVAAMAALLRPAGADQDAGGVRSGANDGRNAPSR
jgi:dihydropteroate synthase